MIEAVIIRRADSTFQGDTPTDNDILSGLKMNKGYKAKITQLSDRSLRHHRLFFGGLLPLAFQYWQPTGGLINQNERDIVNKVVSKIAYASGANHAVLKDFADKAVEEIAQNRASKLSVPPARDIEHFRKWLIVEAGYFDIIETPNGIRKTAKSIAFHKMSQEEFNAFYKNCFDVAWNMFLKHHFKNEAEAEEEAQKLLEMGS